MNRLTYYKDGKPYLKKNDGSKNYMRNADVEAVRRLAAYEDINLEPDSIKNIVESAKRFYETCIKFDMKITFAHMKELLDSEENDRLIILPCRVGDYVWKIYNDGTACYQCEYYHTGGYGADPYCNRDKETIYYPEYGVRPICEKQHWEIKQERMNTLLKIVSLLNDFGRTLFLNRDEAEKRLQELTTLKGE